MYNEIHKALKESKEMNIATIVGDNFKAQSKACRNIVKENMAISRLCHAFVIYLIWH